ncbi:hypothetical protein BGZ94_000485 [Podila epigama]|nr:hypothetical protein BGZ94_000485 [Podila epigama]
MYSNNNNNNNSNEYHHPSSPVRHTEGYEGRIRNTNRDHNDHLVTDASARDQQRHHDLYRRDPSSGFLQHQNDRYSDRRNMDIDDAPLKHSLPPIHTPEEPFYRIDLPGRHMRYFSNVTSQDREDRQGYYSSARHVAPSNTSGNLGHGPPLSESLNRLNASRHSHIPPPLPHYRQQQQQHQQQHRQEQHPHHLEQSHHRHHLHEQQSQQQHHHHHHHQHYEQHQQHQQEQQRPHPRDAHPRLPPLYTALPDQHPGHPATISPPHSDHHSDRSPPPQSQSHPSHHSQHSPTYPRSPDTPPAGPRYSSQHQGQHQGQQPKLPRSIAPAPVGGSPSTSPDMFQPRPVHKLPIERLVKKEPQQIHHRHNQPYPSVPQQAGSKRKWHREHSPARPSTAVVSPTQENAPMPLLSEEASQELHLLSRRSQVIQSSSASSSPSNAIVKKSDTASSLPKTRMQRYQMTTIRCWHGAIAQKSYGIEKRYLCPPPMVQVSAGVNTKQIRTEQPHVTMSVIHEKANVQQQGEMRQDCSLDDSLRCSFRNLHVTGTGSDSSKRFKLGLQVYLNKTSALPTAIMDSNPIPIISKPSKKTAKAGNASCFILNGMSVSLLNRINAQTVRTKYMAVDNNAVCAKIGSWSSFTIKMVKPPPSPPVKVVPASMGVFRAPNHSTKFVPIRMKGESSGPAQQPSSIAMARSNSQQSTQSNQSQNQNQNQNQGQNQNHTSGSSPSSSSSVSGNNGFSSNLFQNQSFQYRHPQQMQPEPVYVFSNSEPVLYGSEIVLINDLTGIMTDRLIIRKVENGKVWRSGTGPVSQMQKIVLEHPDRVHPEDGRAYYLSASSIGSPKIEGKIPLQAAMDRSPLLEYRTSSKKASIMDLTDSPEDEDELVDEDGNSFDGLANSMPRRVSRSHDSVSVDDFVCWTIAGIAKFDYTYFGPIPSSVDTDVDPTKIPTVLSHPRYNVQSNTMTMKVKNVFERLSPEEEARLSKNQDDPYERKLTISEYVYKRCEDVRQPMRDEEGPIQLWLAQHGPIRMRRRTLEEIKALNDGEEAGHPDEDNQDEDDHDEDDEESSAEEEDTNRSVVIPLEDRLPKIARKANAPSNFTNPNNHSNNNNNTNSSNGRHYGGSHLPASMTSDQNKKPRKMVRRPLGLEAELPFGCEVRAAHDAQGHAKAELDLLMVERASGIAYRTGYKVVYTRERERGEWTVEVVSM